MSNSAAASAIVNLDDYRVRRRMPARGAQSATNPVPTYAPAVWVYWVPVWVW
jgi:hypothetical protein